jgi:hypothetical protein
MNMAKRWLHLLAPHCNGLLQLGLVCNDAPVTPWPPSHSVVNLRVHREQVRVSWTQVDGVWPDTSAKAGEVTLRNNKGEVVHQWTPASSALLPESVEEVTRGLVESEEYDPDWQATTPVTCECRVGGRLHCVAQIELNCQYRLDDPF